MTIKIKLRIIFMLFTLMIVGALYFGNYAIFIIEKIVLDINSRILPARGIAFNAGLQVKYLKNNLLIHIMTNVLAQKDEREKNIIAATTNIENLFKQYYDLGKGQDKGFIEMQNNFQHLKLKSNDLLAISRKFDSESQLQYFYQQEY